MDNLFVLLPGAGLLGVALHKLARGWRLPDMKKGAHAQERVGQAIEFALTRERCAVAHRVQEIATVGDIDHLVATPNRLWVIETKHRRKQLRPYERSQLQQAPEAPKKEQAFVAGEIHGENEAKKPVGDWVKIEHRDADGNPTLPKDLIAGTYPPRYQEAPGETDLEVYVLADCRPKALMMVERKIYEIHRLAVHGWRRRGQIAVELDGWRGSEADWFNAMRGVPLENSDPGLLGPQNDKSQYAVSASSFEKKIVTLAAERGGRTEIRMYEGTLDITETWRSACCRQVSGVVDMGLKYLVLPVVSEILGGLFIWWLDRPPSLGSHGTEIPGNPSEHRVPGSTRESEGESANATTTRSSTEASPNDSHQERTQGSGGIPVNADLADAKPENAEEVTGN